MTHIQATGIHLLLKVCWENNEHPQEAREEMPLKPFSSFYKSPRDLTGIKSWNDLQSRFCLSFHFKTYFCFKQIEVESILLVLMSRGKNKASLRSSI
jgi:hypothetical protein